MTVDPDLFPLTVGEPFYPTDTPVVKTFAAGEHYYLSTACLHGVHDYCGSRETFGGKPKKPHTCKFCDAQCICPCHFPPREPATDIGEE